MEVLLKHVAIGAYVIKFSCVILYFYSLRGSFLIVHFFFFHYEQENKEYREFKDKDCRETYAYQLLFVDAFDSEKYATTLTKLCRIGFAMFEDSANDDTRDTMPMYDESSGSSDEGNKLEGSTSSMDFSNRRSGENCRSGSSKSKEKRTKISAKELSYSIERATIVSEKVTTKIDNLVGSNVPSMKTCMKELFAMGMMQKKTDLYF